MMSTNINNKRNNDNVRGDMNQQIIHSSAMTPSIITTINNTNPTPTQVCVNSNGNNIINGNVNNRTKRPAEPFYESYIEDSFVGHWEREDDDPEDIYEGNKGHENGCGNDEDDSALHPSIEFDFDSFGPESIIYAPSAVSVSATSKSAIQESDSTTSSQMKQANLEELKVDDLNDKLKEIMKLNNDDNVIRSNNKEESTNTSNAQPDNGTLDKTNQNITNSTSTIQQINSNSKASEPDPLSYHFNNETSKIDFNVIEPYKKVISHAGYCHHFDSTSPKPKPGEPAPAVIVFSACYLPDRSRRDYNYVMDHLFLYVLSSLHELIADDYILVYLHNTQPSTTSTKASTSLNNNSVGESPATNSNNTKITSSSSSEDTQQNQNNLPTFTWIKRCYQMIDRKLRKNLKILYLVKPTFWLKTIVIMCKPFISSKFSKKLHFVENMDQLKKCLPIEKLILPASAVNI